MTPEEREAYLDEPIDINEPGEILYYHRDGTIAKTRREAFAIMGQRDDPTHPDYHWTAKTENKRYLLSSIFLCIDHGFGITPGVPPLLFETMLFFDDMGGEGQWRYYREVDQLKAHRRIVRYMFWTAPLWGLNPRLFVKVRGLLRRGLQRVGN